MARHPQSREAAKLKGATKKDPQRYRNEPPKNSKTLGDPPPHMAEKAREVWYELVQNSLPGVITASERFVFEILSNLISEYRGNPELFATTKYTAMIGLLGCLGLSPADRSKLGVDPGKKNKKDEFEDF